MSELLSVGLDVGTTTTQLIVSRLQVENRATGFAVPRMEISKRQICYRSPVRMTPLEGTLVDGAALKRLVEAEYTAAGICRADVDTGAVIITGETSRRENARRVLEALSEYAGEFVVATAGPHLESVLAAKGAGAVEYARTTGKTVLHMDIGGGTSNLALIREGRILRTGCMDVGGRLVKMDETGSVRYVSPVLEGLCAIRPGDRPGQEDLESLAQLLTRALEMAAGLLPPDALMEKLTTRETGSVWLPPQEPVTVSFSGGVADCIENELPALSFGDIGPVLGSAIRKSRLCRGDYMLGKETIRATVIGAGCHSTQLSGSTVHCRNVTLPVKNLPVAVFTQEEQEREDLAELIARRKGEQDAEAVVLAFPGWSAPGYSRICGMAEAIARSAEGKAVWVATETDMAKALGQCLQLRLGQDTPCLCIDRVQLQPESFLDVGEPLGPCLPVVIKTLVLRS